MQAKNAFFFLSLVAALWGLTFPLIENSMQLHDPFLFVALRFSIAALILIPIFKFFQNATKELLIAGLILGVLNCGAYLSQTIGLQTTNASRAAFLTGTNIVFIPFIAPAFKLQVINKYDVISGVLCAFGIYVLTGAGLENLSVGDFWILLCAFCVALSIIYISYLSKNNFDPYLLTTSQIGATALISWGLCFLFSDFNFNSLINYNFIGTIIYCSLFATIVSLSLQAKYQKYVSAQKAGLIFCLEPVFATFFDMLINHAELLPNIFFGGIIILLSIVFLELKG
ncbi:MAG TPA: DMT family transporter [Parachlamydiaceae bacterium]|nr:DMT family transporter [Parachlamydiaceae bacterium]